MYLPVLQIHCKECFKKSPAVVESRPSNLWGTPDDSTPVSDPYPSGLQQLTSEPVPHNYCFRLIGPMNVTQLRGAQADANDGARSPLSFSHHRSGNPHRVTDRLGCASDARAEFRSCDGEGGGEDAAVRFAAGASGDTANVGQIRGFCPDPPPVARRGWEHVRQRTGQRAD